MRAWGLILSILSCSLAFGSASAITADQVDDFEDGTVMGWEEGDPSPNPPTNVSTGGPEGVDDNFLQNVSSGAGFAGSRMIMFNTAQWTGDYLAADVVAIEAKMANLGGSELAMRIAIWGPPGPGTTRFGSTNAAILPADGIWRTVVFGLEASDLTRFDGTATLEEVLAGVTELRILSRVGGPGWQGDEVAGTLGIDDIRAVPAQFPVETESWGRIKAFYR
jgi:hypothetical protein